MEHLFSYGTLQMPKVQQETCGRLLSGKKDALVGYVLSEIKITDPGVIQTSGTDTHPILKYTGNASDIVAGTVFELTPEELMQADEYEVEEYLRVMGTFTSGRQAWAYVCRASELGKS
ncbi:gamma-glutamylcyclotransferase family protein [Aestuariibacter salexigens]|uniref:gamma-glutamylcyclotransferase family protein n=1 Tax=Aestuariibacter salexigens TaxID=226010 RepID=UPI000479B30A|nr:gamma-glutamylcyclotransferase family protein [Aestuariibacter salexigens]